MGWTEEISIFLLQFRTELESRKYLQWQEPMTMNSKTRVLIGVAEFVIREMI